MRSKSIQCLVSLAAFGLLTLTSPVDATVTEADWTYNTSQGVENYNLEVICPMILHKVWLPIYRGIKVGFPE